MEVEGIVLQVTPYKDKDAMVNVLSINGIVSFLARGIMDIKSKNAALIMLYNKIRIELNDKHNGLNLSLITGVVLSNASKIYESLDAMLTLSLMGELTIKAVDSDNSVVLFQLFDNALSSLYQYNNFLAVRLIFLARIIELLGIGLQINQCVDCGSKTKIVSVSFPHGGLICNKCFDMYSMNNQSEIYIKLARYVFKADINQSGTAKIPEKIGQILLDDLINHLNNQLSIRINSYKLIKQSSF